MARIVDLRSDTVTKPTDEMRQAMRDAEVGDDARGDDPTVKRLEDLAAHMTGQEAGLFVASGTMGNLVCVLTHASRGDEMIVGRDSHMFRNESGAVSALGGIHVNTISDEEGYLAPGELERAIRKPDGQYPQTRLICMENTHNRAWGRALTAARVEETVSVAHSRGVAVHLDGARVFNAAAALAIPVETLTADVDSLTFCLSKGLGAPIGSVVCASSEFITEARAYRRMLGGAMRQAGVIAAAGIVALRTMPQRLLKDHQNAKALAEDLAATEMVILDPASVTTNIVYFDVEVRADQFAAELATESGILCGSVGPHRIRMVTHREITRGDIARVTTATTRAVSACQTT